MVFSVMYLIYTGMCLLYYTLSGNSFPYPFPSPNVDPYEWAILKDNWNLIDKELKVKKLVDSLFWVTLLSVWHSGLYGT